jgi:hypothetical protein
MNRKARGGIPDRTPAQAAYIKQDLLKLKGTNRYLHVSCSVQMIPVNTGGVIEYKPWIEKPGHTYRRPKVA